MMSTTYLNYLLGNFNAFKNDNRLIFFRIARFCNEEQRIKSVQISAVFFLNMVPKIADKCINMSIVLNK